MNLLWGGQPLGSSHFFPASGLCLFTINPRGFCVIQNKTYLKMLLNLMNLMPIYISIIFHHSKRNYKQCHNFPGEQKDLNKNKMIWLSKSILSLYSALSHLSSFCLMAQCDRDASSDMNDGPSWVTTYIFFLVSPISILCVFLLLKWHWWTIQSFEVLANRSSLHIFRARCIVCKLQIIWKLVKIN